MGARRPSILVVFVTCPTRAQARILAAALLKRRLAACVSLLDPVESWFWWQGKIDRAREVLLIIKTSSTQFARLRAAIQRLHPYDVPEIIGWPATQAHRPYANWVAASVRPSLPRSRLP